MRDGTQSRKDKRVKKKGIAIIAAACALCMALFVAGCGGSGSSSASGSAAGSGSVAGSGTFAGNWTNMTEDMLAENNEEVSLEELEGLEDEAALEEVEAEENESKAEADAENASSSAEGENVEEADAAAEEPDVQYPLVTMFVTLNDDGTAQVAVAGFGEEGTWEASGSAATITVPGMIPMKATVSGDTMKIEQEGITVQLKKTESANPFVYDDMNWEEALVEPEMSDVSPVTIADDDKVTITVTGKGTDYTGDPGFRLTLVNKTQGTIGLDVEEAFTVGGAEVGAQAGVTNADAEFSVEPGATSENMFLYFPADELEGGVEKLADVSGKISVYDEEQDDYIATYDFKM